MNKPAVNHRRAHKAPQRRDGARRPHVGVPLPAPFGRLLLPPRWSLNWSLRRYVRAWSLRVWLRRQASQAAGASGPANRDGPLRAPGRRAGTAGEARSLASGERANGVSRTFRRALRYRIHRNRQMEHLTQVAVSLRGGVRRGLAITPRERTDGGDLLLTTLSNKACV